jgi:hypothetical protein
MSDLRALYEKDDSGIRVGIVSQQPASFFDALRTAIDEDDPHARCSRYKGHYNEANPAKRRLFMGSNIAMEPWEVLEIVGTETYGLYSGIVFVESNRTQNFNPRQVRRLHHGPIIAQIFGVPESSVQIRNYFNEDPTPFGLQRENLQRLDIINGWLELGMTRDDIGFITDVDESFHRDYLLALQTCHGIPALDYEMHHCHYKHVRITASSEVFETSPECISANHKWNRPSAMIGHCIQGVADPDLHPPTPRDPALHHQPGGYGGGCDYSIVDRITDNRYPSWHPVDFRDGCAGQLFLDNSGTWSNHTQHTAFHMHNFFAEFNTTRFKYETYAHPIDNVEHKKIHELQEDLTMMYRCVTGKEVQTDYWHEPGGFASMRPFQPLYFYDDDYRQRRHEHVRQLTLADDAMIDALLAAELQEAAENSSSLATSLSSSLGSSSMSDLRALYEKDDSGIHVGIVSQQPASFFDALRAAIDEDDPHARCSRYKGYYNETHPASRRIFMGSNIATEPWEVFEIVGTETYGLYSGIVFVESNRTQNFSPRRVRRLKHGPIMAQIFGVPESAVQIRNYVNEDDASRDLIRENQQRFDIMNGWLELGMTRDDIGIVADIDETFSRDMLLAMQTCHGIPALDYDMHHCHYKHVRLTATTQVYEGSPECTSNRDWIRPSAMIGHCIEGIADPDLHPPTPREPGTHTQARGYGGACWYGTVDQITDHRYPSWGPADLRDGCAPQFFLDNQSPNWSNYTHYISFHAHNFFAEFNTTRFKYETYAHAVDNVGYKKIHELQEDLTMMYRCVTGNEVQSNYVHDPGGFASLKPFQPIYFYDDDYRQRRHEHVRQLSLADDAMIDALRQAVDAN